MADQEAPNAASRVGYRKAQAEVKKRRIDRERGGLGFGLLRVALELAGKDGGL